MAGGFTTLRPPRKPRRKTTMNKIKLGTAKEEVVVSDAKAEFAKRIEAYKVKNPVKYAQKKVALEAKLASL